MSIINLIKDKLKKIQENLHPLAGMKTQAVDKDFNPITDFNQSLTPEDYFICDDIYPATLIIVCKTKKC